MKTRTSRSVALLTGGVLASTMLLQAAPAHADKSKSLKVGAVVLGVGAAILLAKKKEVPAAIAGAGAYYAYKKSKDAKNDQYGYYPGDNTSNDGNYYPGDEYAYGNTGNYPNDAPYYGNSGDDVYPGYALRAQRRNVQNSVRSFRRSGR